MARTLVVDGRVIGDTQDCYVIAEVGHNHQGRLDKALELVRAAKECGADAVKLQKRDNRTLYTRAMYEMPYKHDNSFGPTYGAHREALELSVEDYRCLQQYAREIGITLFATVFDLLSADAMARLEMPAYKIASADLTNVPLLRHVAALGKPVFISTGGGTMDDVQRAHDAVAPVNPQVCLLQCTASYPVEPEEMNLRVITTYRERFPELVIGCSDHQNGIAMALMAYVLGARVIEKHFTLNRAWKGTDHAFSLEPAGLRKLVRDLRRARTAFGDGVKRPLPSEQRGLYKMGKKLVAARALPAGHVLQREDIAVKSPNDGLPPYELERLIGLALTRPMAEDEAFTRDDLDDSKGAIADVPAVAERSE